MIIPAYCDLCDTSYTEWGLHAATWRHRVSLWLARIRYLS